MTDEMIDAELEMDEQDDFEEDDSESDLDETLPEDTEEDSSEDKVRLMAQAADDVRASDIDVLELRELTIIADYFLICTGKSSIQIRAIADRIEEKLRDRGYRKLRSEGYQEATWILLDYGDVIAHIMAEEQREFYNLEGFWSAAPRLDVELGPESSLLRGPA